MTYWMDRRVVALADDELHSRGRYGVLRIEPEHQRKLLSLRILYTLASDVE